LDVDSQHAAHLSGEMMQVDKLDSADQKRKDKSGEFAKLSSDFKAQVPTLFN
jgi:hypothetical protein